MTPSLSTLELLLEILVVQALVLSILFFVRRISSATQHLLLSASVIMVLVMTLVSPLVQSRQLGLIPIQGTVAELEIPQPAGGPAISPQDGATARDDARLPAVNSSTSGRENRFARTLGAVWLLGTSLLLLWMLLGLAYSFLLSKQARPHEQSRLLDCFRRALESEGLCHDLKLVESDTVRVPVVFGILRPRVILPISASEWSEDRLNAVLLHESAHILRRDLVFQFLGKLTCALYWFNPLAWLIERKLFLAGERASDDHVIRQEISPADYAEHLMEASAELGTERNPIWATAAMAEGTAFKDRILSILDPNIRRGEPTMSNQATVTLAAMAIVVPLLVFGPWRIVSAPADQTVSAVETRPAGEAAAVPQSATDRSTQDDVATLIRMLQIADPKMREHAATALGEQGNEAAVLPLIDVILNDRNAVVREHASTALGMLADTRATTPLTEVMLHDPDPRVREHAASALGQLRDRRSYDVLLQTMRGDDTEQVRAHAAYALGMLGDSRALEALLTALHDRSPAMRMHAAMGLGELGDRRAIDALRRALNDPDEQARFYSGESLRKIQGR